MDIKNEIIEDYPFLKDLSEGVLEEFFNRVIINNYGSGIREACLIINKVV